MKKKLSNKQILADCIAYDVSQIRKLYPDIVKSGSPVYRINKQAEIRSIPLRDRNLPHLRFGGIG